MEFCSQCKSMMMPKDGMWVCRKCGYKIPRDSDEKMVSRTEQKPREVPVLEGNISLQPTTNARCPECENGTAYWEMKQTRKADEPPTLFLTCTKCGHRWRKY